MYCFVYKNNMGFKVILFMTIILLFLQSSIVSAKAEENEKLRGVWVSTVFNLDYPKNKTSDPESLKKEADSILDDCEDLGINAVFFQVRPASDALYKSKIYPWSMWLTGTQGTAPDDDFDPLEYWVSEAHKRGIELHAWINPYRVTKSSGKGEDVWAALDESNPAKKNPEYTVKYTDGNYYFDPAIPEVRELVVDGALEIVNNYDVDGIHIDDYFYPGTDFSDDKSFEKYNNGFTNKDDWRRNNVNLLIKDMNEQIHKADPDVDFGVSPSGIWANKSNNPLGSNTNGHESYYSLFADTRTWAAEGWIDYIAPQIYWNIGFAAADYEVLSDWWADVVKDSDTKLYIGMADYRTDGADSSSAWYKGKEIEKQLDMNAANDNVDGEIHFRYTYIKNIPELKSIIKKKYTGESDNTVVPTVPVTVPASNEISVYVDGIKLEFDQKPIIENSRVLVPMRAIFEALGARIEWFPKTENILAYNKDKEITLKVGSANMFINGTETIVLDVPAKIVGSRTLVPLRAVSEVFDADVQWDNATRTVTVITNN